MKNRFMIGDKVRYWIGRDGMREAYSDIVEVEEVLRDAVVVSGNVKVSLNNVQRIELTREELAPYTRKYVYGAAILSYSDPFISYVPSIGLLNIINGRYELRALCGTFDEMQHAIEMICEDYQLKPYNHEKFSDES